MKYSFKEVKSSFHSEEPWINVFLFSFVTVPLTYLMVNFTRVTPNVISLLSFLFGSASAYFYWQGEVYLGSGLYVVSYIFDAIDGKVARITSTGKIYGAWADVFVDRFNLVFISLAIASNYYFQHNDATLIILNSIFLGLAFVGWESRYNINLHIAKRSNKQVSASDKKETKYTIWCRNKGLVKEPISLPEIFLFHLILAPVLGIEYYSLIIVSAFLVLRLLKQQLFWLNEVKQE